MPAASPPRSGSSSSLPTILDIISADHGATWAENLVVVRPDEFAGSHLYQYVGHGAEGRERACVSLDRTTGGLVLLAWFVVLFVVAAVLLKRRDA